MEAQVGVVAFWAGVLSLWFVQTKWGAKPVVHREAPVVKPAVRYRSNRHGVTTVGNWKEDLVRGELYDLPRDVASTLLASGAVTEVFDGGN